MITNANDEFKMLIGCKFWREIASNPVSSRTFLFSSKICLRFQLLSIWLLWKKKESWTKKKLERTK